MSNSKNFRNWIDNIYDNLTVNSSLTVNGKKITGDLQEIMMVDENGDIVVSTEAKLRNIAEPEDDKDAATKGYVDGKISQAVGGLTSHQTLTLNVGNRELPTDTTVVFLKIEGVTTGVVPAPLSSTGTTIELMVISHENGGSYTLEFGFPDYPTNLITSGGYTSDLIFDQLGQGLTMTYNDEVKAWILHDGGATFA